MAVGAHLASENKPNAVRAGILFKDYASGKTIAGTDIGCSFVKVDRPKCPKRLCGRQNRSSR